MTERVFSNVFPAFPCAILSVDYGSLCLVLSLQNVNLSFFLYKSLSNSRISTPFNNLHLFPFEDVFSSFYGRVPDLPKLINNF